MSDNITIEKRIQTLHKEKGMTQEALTETLGISAQAVSKWERHANFGVVEVIYK